MKLDINLEKLGISDLKTVLQLVEKTGTDLNKSEIKELVGDLRTVTRLLEKYGDGEKPKETKIEKEKEKSTGKKKYKPKYKRYSKKWRKELKRIEPFLNKFRSKTDILDETRFSRAGQNYNRVDYYLKNVYKRRLMKMKRGNRTYYKIQDAKGSHPKKYEPTATDRDEIFAEIVELLDKEKVGSFFGAFKKATGRKYIGGKDYRDFEIYCNKKGIDYSKYKNTHKKYRKRKQKTEKPEEEKKATERETKEKPEKKEIKETKKVEKPDFSPYMRRKVDYTTWRSDLIRKVMKFNDMNEIEAAKYLAATWNKGGRDSVSATQLLSKKIGGKTTAKSEEDSRLDKFPDLKGLPKHMKKVLIDMLERISQNKENTLKYRVEGKILGLEEEKDWDAFCTDFLMKAYKINTVMKDNFSVTRNQDGLIIKAI